MNRSNWSNNTVNLSIKFVCNLCLLVSTSTHAMSVKRTLPYINDQVRSVQMDMMISEKCGQWLLSSYAPFKNKLAFPGFEDKSFEEVRLEYYEAIKNGTVEQYKEQLRGLLQEAIKKIRTLKTPSEETVNLINEIYNTPLNPNRDHLNICTNQTASVNQSTFRDSLFSPANQQTISCFSKTTTNSLFNKQPLQSPFGGLLFSPANQTTTSPLNKTATHHPFNKETQSTLDGSFLSPKSQSTTNSLFNSRPLFPLVNKQTTSPFNTNSTFCAETSSNSPINTINSPFNKQTTTNLPFNSQTDKPPISSLIINNNSPNQKAMYYKCCKDILCKTVMCISCGNSFHRDCTEQLSKVQVLDENRVICCHEEHKPNREEKDYELLRHENNALRMETELFRRVIAEKDKKYEIQKENMKLLMKKISLIESKQTNHPCPVPISNDVTSDIYQLRSLSVNEMDKNPAKPNKSQGD